MNVILRHLMDLAGRVFGSLDWLLCLALGGLMLIGCAVLYSAGESPSLAINQAARYVIGIGLMWALSKVPPIRLRDFTPLVFAATLIPLIAVLFIGTGRHGAHWINLGGFYFQPAELLKLSLPMMVAWHLHRQPLPPSFWTTVLGMGIVGLPVGLILLQPDFGSAMMVMAPGMFALYLAGMSWWWFVAGASAVAVLVPVAWMFLMQPYQKARVMTFLEGLTGEHSDPQGESWNIIQAQIAIGGGGFSGKGWGQGTQSHLNYIPEHTTDFIFAVLAEEFGWLGVMVTLALYLIVIGRCLWIAGQGRDAYSRLLAGALGLGLFVYVLVNGGMVAGLLPVVGVPMPLLSYGGTAAVSLLASMGVVMAVRAHQR